MFGSRKKGRKPYKPPTAATVNPSAATAAVSAYNLSSAAAAAALRALPAAPTNVAAVQTKRTQRRSASLSSEGSRRPLSPVPSLKRVIGLGGNEQRNGRVASPVGVPTLRRRDSASSMRSVSSMSERTFRSSSPHPSRGFAITSIASSPGSSIAGSRNPINAAGAAAVAAATGSSAASRSRSMPPPPVPAIPQHVIDSHASVPPEQVNTKLKKSRRPTSLSFVQQPLRLASQQQKSQNRNRSSWFGTTGVGNTADIRTSDVPMDINGYARAQDNQRPMSPTERPGSRSSLHNFSYPSRQRLSSPPASPTHAKKAELPGSTESGGAIGAAGAAFAAALSVRKTPPMVRSVSTEEAPQLQASSKPSAAAASRRSASTSRVPGHSRAPTQADQELVYDANSRRMVPRGELLTREQTISETHAKPVQPHQSPHQQRKKKQQHVQQHVQQHAQPLPSRPQQTHPASPVATVSSPPSQQLAPKVAAVTEPRAAQQSEKPAPEQITEVPTMDKIEEVQPVPALSTSASTPSSSVSSLPALASLQTVPPPGAHGPTPVAIHSLASPVDISDDNGAITTEDTRPALVKRPSVVHEDPELEEQEERRTRSPAGENDKARSRSPVRTAHFSPVVANNNLTVRRHSPPPRSISPRKSAMKQTSSPRDTSPSDSATETAAAPYQPPATTDALKRKKANRVSFDEKATVLSGPPTSPAQIASPISSLPGAIETAPDNHAAQQPPARSRSWFSNMGRSKKKATSDMGNDDDDVIMKPRPALPSFGSVRDKSFSTSQPEERALVKPGIESQPSARPPATSSPPPPSALKSINAPLEALGTSSDHAVGAIVAASGSQSASVVARNTANTSRYREPLPPVVTSVDGTGHVSDSDASTSSDEDDGPETTTTTTSKAPVEDGREHSPVLRFDEEQDTTVPAPIPSTPAVTGLASEGLAGGSPTSDASSPGSASPKPKTVPAISISHPSQENIVTVRGTNSDDKDDGVASATQKSSSVCNILDVPGTFPDTDSDTATVRSSPTQPGFSSTAVPVRQDAFEPTTQDGDLSSSPQMPATVFATHMPTLHEEAPLDDDVNGDDDSDSEVFSDAYEDLSDIEGDGFLSLDAVVESPIAPTLKSPIGASILTSSPPRINEPDEAKPSALPKSTSSTTSATSSTAATAAGGAAVIGGTAFSMSALMASAASKSGGMGTMDPDDKDDWDKVKAFWRGLTEEKRSQLEREARDDAAADGDLEEESSTAKKPRRKKSAETRLAEKRAIQEISPSTYVNDAEEEEEGARSKPLEKKTEAAAATRIRRSMRGGPATVHTEEKGSAASGGKAGPSGLPSTLRRRGSDSSESSFRPPRAGTGFRKSLRTEPGMTAADTEAITLANTAANENLSHRGSRFSLRSLSPTGSAARRGSTESSPQIRRTLRDGGGFAASESKRMASPGPMANATLRGKAGGSDGGFLSSLGRKNGSKFLQRSKNSSGGGRTSSSRTRFGDSSDDDNDDVFGPPSRLGGTPARRSASAGTGAYTFRSRFVDSSDEDEVIPEHRTAPPRNGKNHVVPKTMRASGNPSPSTRPRSSSMSKSLSVPGKLAEAENAKRPQSALPASKSFSGAPASGTAFGSAPGNGNIGTTTLRRTRSGRGQLVPPPPSYSPATVGAVGAGQGASSPPTPTRHRRASSLMSVLRRKKPESISSPSSYLGGVGAAGEIGRGELVDSAARRDTQLERNARELAAMRSSSAGSSQLQRPRSLSRTLRNGNGNGSTPRIMPLDGEDSDDLDEDDSEGGPGRGTGAGVNSSWPLRGPGPAANSLAFLDDGASNVGGDSLQKKKKFPVLRRMFRLKD